MACEVPKSLTAPVEPPEGPLPRTYGELRLYTIDVLERLAEGNLDKRKIREALKHDPR